MTAKTPKCLRDIEASSVLIQRVTRGLSLEEYAADPVLRAAVERHFEIIGEAVRRLQRHDPDSALHLADADRIVAFRNVLIHGYDLVDDATVWEVIGNQLPTLLTEVRPLLGETGASR